MMFKHRHGSGFLMDIGVMFMDSAIVSGNTIPFWEWLIFLLPWIYGNIWDVRLSVVTAINDIWIIEGNEWLFCGNLPVPCEITEGQGLTVLRTVRPEQAFLESRFNFMYEWLNDWSIQNVGSWMEPLRNGANRGVPATNMEAAKHCGNGRHICSVSGRCRAMVFVPS
jgi:hypothetical protein